jgi:hypothetical protein
MNQEDDSSVAAWSGDQGRAIYEKGGLNLANLDDK